MKKRQEIERQMDEMARKLELTEQTHKIQDLEEEAGLREKEAAREELGSDYESDDAERVDVTQVLKSDPSPEERLAIDQSFNELFGISQPSVSHPSQPSTTAAMSRAGARTSTQVTFASMRNPLPSTCEV